MPGRQHVRGGFAKDQRMYEHIEASAEKKAARRRPPSALRQQR